MECRGRANIRPAGALPRFQDPADLTSTAASRWLRLPRDAVRRLPAPLLNGASVALGVALIQAGFGLAFGAAAASVAASGAVCSSLPDVPNPPHRTLRRVLPAAWVVSGVTLAVGFCRPYPVAMGLLITAIAFLTLLAMAWGPRAGALSFSGTLAMVFAMAWPAAGSTTAVLAHAGWVLAGALAYVGWAGWTSWKLQGQYRRLALAAALEATVQRLQSRAAMMTRAAPVPEDTVRASIRDDATLAELLQAARDQLFAAPPTPAARRRNAQLLRLVELRDLLLASRLDMGLLGHDAAGQAWCQAVAYMLQRMADTLAAVAQAVRQGHEVPRWVEAPTTAELQARLDAITVAADDPRRHLATLLQARLGHMLDDVQAVLALTTTADVQEGLSHEDLQLFVSPEGWPLAALKPHLRLDSPVLRHAIRGGLALGSAYALAHALPWAAHPHWLVLSVAVVLRGNLEQTLARRNDRLLGTVVGCLIVVGLARVDHLGLLSTVFLVAIGVAHAYVNQRYLVAATAATVMALLQPHLAVPGSGFAIGERLADTALGALLAWAFCFVLPSWERRHWAVLSRRLIEALARHAEQVLQVTPAQRGVPLRLSRQQVYQALTALAAAAQRSSAEPRRVRLPEREVDALLTHSYRLMAQLSAVQQALGRRRGQLDPAATQATLAQARQAFQQGLLDAAAPAAGPAEPLAPLEDGAAGWPAAAEAQAPLWWLERRLRLAVAEAHRLAHAAGALRAATSPAAS